MTITPCLWFDGQAQEAAEHYVSIFPGSRITDVARYPVRSPGGQEPGEVMTVSFELDGRPFVGLNGGPQFPHTEAVSFQWPCATQEEIDRVSDALIDAGGEQGPCGWVKDRFGVSWQVFPQLLTDLENGDDAEAAKRGFEAMLQMRRIDLAAIEAAVAGTPA